MAQIFSRPSRPRHWRRYLTPESGTNHLELGLSTERVTLVSINLSNGGEEPPEMIISSGSVVENISVPPSGGCVVSVMVRPDKVSDLMDYPGFHQMLYWEILRRNSTDTVIYSDFGLSWVRSQEATRGLQPRRIYDLLFGRILVLIKKGDWPVNLRIVRFDLLLS